MKGNFIVLTPEKIEDIFKDLEEEVLSVINKSQIYTISYIETAFESKKQELLKSIQK